MSDQATGQNPACEVVDIEARNGWNEETLPGEYAAALAKDEGAENLILIKMEKPGIPGA